MTSKSIEEQFSARKQFDFFYQGEHYVFFQKDNKVEEHLLFIQTGSDEYVCPPFSIKSEVFQLLKKGLEPHEIENGFVAHPLTSFSYQGKDYIVFQKVEPPESKLLFEHIGEGKYILSPRVTKQALNSILEDNILGWIQIIKKLPLHLPQEEPEIADEDVKIEKTTKSAFKKKFFNPLIVCSFVAAISISILHYSNKENIYEGLDCEELLEQLPEESRSCQEILMENFNTLGKYLGEEFSELEQEELIQRAERFASYLSEEELTIFKYQLSRVSIVKKEYDDGYGAKYSPTSLKIFLEEGNRYGYQLESAFCDMITNCYLDQKENYFVFNNQKFWDPRTVELGHNFPFYNKILFLSKNYPEYQSSYRSVLQSEGMLYYQLVLQILDSDIDYLPFCYQMEDVIRSYQQFSWSERKVNDFFGRIGIIQSFPSNNLYSFYECRHQVITTASDYFIKRESAIVGQYIRAITPQLCKGGVDQKPLEDLLLCELVDHYEKLVSLMDQINQSSPIVLCEYEDFQRIYKQEFLPDVYEYCRFVGLISKEQTEEDFVSNFYDRVGEQVKVEDVEFYNEWQAQKALEIFHYPISTRK